MADTSIGPVVVGVDGTLASMRALDLAADEAMGRAVPLVVVYTIEPPLDPALPQHQRLLDLAVSRAQADHPGLAVSADLVRGAPVEGLVAWSRRASLLVVGHANGDSRPVAARVAERSVAPVIVFRPFADRTQPRGRPVVVGVDGVGHADAALAFAFEEAAMRGAPLSAVHVWSGLGGFVPGEARRQLTETMSAWSARYAGVAVHSEVRGGCDVGVTLADAARDAALVVIGAHEDGVGRPAVRAVSRALIDRAYCPVAVVDGTRPG
jgi:nucleotide-binding universal stress UspA family protein